MKHENPESAILDQERQALDRWSQGQPRGYADNGADDMTYFDDIGAHRRVDGIEAVRGYLASLEGEIPPHNYELVDPKVQIYGDTGVVTMRYETTLADGQPGPPWKATTVYRLTNGEWRMVHAHWSLVKS